MIVGTKQRVSIIIFNAKIYGTPYKAPEYTKLDHAM